MLKHAKQLAEARRTGTEYDFTIVACRVVAQAIGQELPGKPLDNPRAGENPTAVALGKAGGAKGTDELRKIKAPRPAKAAILRALGQLGVGDATVKWRRSRTRHG